MGISYVYKKFKNEDSAIIPFDAHKQYNFTSQSAVNNKLSICHSKWTSESISMYDSGSSTFGGYDSDTINVVKYNQIDHLFYKNYLSKPHLVKELENHWEQKRNLYEQLNILSIPTGLYGAEIKKSSFYLSSSIYEVVDDSYGNLIISGTNKDDYPNDINENVLRIDPVKGFKKYDLGVHDGYVNVTEWNKTTSSAGIFGFHAFYDGQFFRRGLENPGAPGVYTSNNNRISYYPRDLDDSYFFNELNYNSVTFHKQPDLVWNDCYIPSVNFNSLTSSYIMVEHQDRFNFNTNQEFSVSFYIKPDATGSQNDISNSEKRYIIAKSTTYTQITDPPDYSAGAGTGVSIASGSIKIQSPVPTYNYPFEIYLQSQSLYFQRSDGHSIQSCNGEITGSGASPVGTCQRTSHILCQLSSSKMQIWFDGVKIAETTNTLTKSTRNNANLYIGSKGKPDDTMIDTSATSINSNPHRTFNGYLSNINIWSRAYSPTQITNISESVNASPIIGNLFYENGFATITHPKYSAILKGGTNQQIQNIQFQGTHRIYEHEYQCTVGEHEFNHTTNKSTIKPGINSTYEFEPFISSSYFKPFVTTIGLYNDAYELLAVGKLGQPIRMSDETDTTFIIRFDE